MPLFKKKPDTLIPPVPAPLASSLSSTISPRSSSNTYVTSREGNAPSNDSNLLANRYNRNRGAGDVYSRGTAELDKDRNELFSGYKPTKTGSGRFFDGLDVENLATGEENEDDVEGIKQQTRFVKQESVNSTRNALRLAREAEETGQNTLSRLGEQSEKLANTERFLDISKGHSQRAADNADEIKQLNRSIFIPVITFNMKGKREAKEAKLQQRHDDERMQREEVMKRLHQTHGHLGEVGRANSEELLGGRGRMKTEEQLLAGKEQRKRYQFENNASDDELEDEMDGNLNEIGEMAQKLKALGMAMNKELDHHNQWIDNIAGKTDRLDDKLRMNTHQLNKIK